ncbi:sensor histidine kinase [Mucilaginibacter psychrotolerans]|uniref:histidine kinase n=1 Tax=Mucilaginibacter psychrotolerans TaxID=1524096 RepID=A0A4Y8RY34_9SPHI|nr:ATP-binding protein [Mucilaginibacter psychrotolerans]TFF30350.1 PAS domain S-box protein [Mucilaginibacter psychrotolerans]
MEGDNNDSSKYLEIIDSVKNENLALRTEIQQLKCIETSDAGQTAYQESQMRFRTVFEFSRLGNKIISSDLKIIQINPAMVALLGYSKKEDIIGTRILDYSPESEHQHWALLQKHLWEESTPFFTLETVLIRKDKTLIRVRVTSILFPDQGTNLGYTTIEDITEQHALKLQKEEFIGIASHELKTPITRLKAVLQLLNRMIKKESNIPEKIVTLAHEGQLYVGKLIHLVEDLLNSSKLEQGQLSIHRIKFPLSDVIEGCCNHVRLDRKHYVTHSGDLDTEIYADRHKIDQILVNFVNNAVKYAPLSEEIAIKVEKLTDRIKISVTDKGNGIPPEDVPHLFDRYYQVKKGEIQSSGLGLGLYISSEIIKRHGGEIGVDSQIGVGSSFWFTLPIED